MARRKSPNRRKKSGIKRGFGFIIVIMLFICSAFLFTCQRNMQQGPVSHIQPEKPSVDKRPNRAGNDHSNNQPECVSHKADTNKNEKTEEQSVPLSSSIPPPQSDIIENHDQPVTPITQPGSELSRGNSSSRKIALTFDAGASAKPASTILDVLAKHNIRSTFFLTGKWMEKNPSLTKRIIAEGHEIGNHTYSHKSLTDLGTGDIIHEVDRTERIADELTGHTTKPFLRVPYGSRDKRVLAVLAEQGYRSIYWDLDSWDSVKADITSEQIEDRILSKVRNGYIILLHCGSQATSDALDSMLDKLVKDGYEPVKVSQLDD
ncbi:MAG: polysaccharide deacetylase family protein [Armatimonadota bacterium]